MEGHGHSTEAEANLPEGMIFQYSTDGSTWSNDVPADLSNTDEVHVQLGFATASN